MPAPLRSATSPLGRKVVLDPSLHDTATQIFPPPGSAPFPPASEAEASLRADLAAHQKRLESMFGDMMQQLPRIISDALQQEAKHQRRRSSASMYSSEGVPPKVHEATSLPGQVSEEEIPFGPAESGTSDPIERIATKRAKMHAGRPSEPPSPHCRTTSIRNLLFGQPEEVPSTIFSQRQSIKRPERKKVSGVKEKVDKVIEQRKSREFVSESWCGRTQIIARSIVEAPLFESASGTLIMLCAVLIGVEAEWSMKTIGEPAPPVFRILNSTFNLFFFGELLLRIMVDGLLFFSWFNPSLHWNVLDFTLIAFAIVEEVLLVWFSGQSGLNLSVLRTLRMLRLVRLLRILKVVRFFSELRIMVNGVLGSAKSLFWALLLIILVNFLFGVFFMQISLTYLESTDAQAELLLYFGSLPRTMMTLYQAISGGMDWGNAVVTLLPVSEWLEYVFSAYVFFTVFCCLNIITGIFVDNAKALKVADEENMHHEAMRERAKWISQVAELFSRMDRENRGQVSKEDFIYQLSHSDRVTTCFDKLGINTDTTDTDELWQMFDSAANNNIDQDEFAVAIKQFHGQARSIDLFKLRKEVREVTKLVQQLASREVARTKQDTTAHR